MNVDSSIRFVWGSKSTTFSTKDRRLGEALAAIFSAFLSSDSVRDDSRDRHVSDLTASVGGEEFSFDSLGQAVLGLEDAVAQRLLDGCAHLLLHSGAVTNGNRTILILGSSGAGKTTMTLEFVRMGYRFLADEYTAIDASGGLLHPFPRCTVVKEVVRDLPAGAQFEIETDHGLRSFHLPRNAGTLDPHEILDPCFIFPTYRHGSTSHARSLRPAEVCAKILPNTFNFEGNEDVLWPALSALSTRAKACVVEYGDVESGIRSALHCFACQ